MTVLMSWCAAGCAYDDLFDFACSGEKLFWISFVLNLINFLKFSSNSSLEIHASFNIVYLWLPNYTREIIDFASFFSIEKLTSFSFYSKSPPPHPTLSRQIKRLPRSIPHRSNGWKGKGRKGQTFLTREEAMANATKAGASTTLICDKKKKSTQHVTIR
jgi:hypothetical protein